jgi:hypothetical protein
MFNSNKSSIPIGVKNENSPQGLALCTLGVKAEIEKNIFQFTPKLLINA